mgnify:FL=1
MTLRSMTMVWALLAAGSASASTDLDWLQGDWCGERQGVQNEEHWGSARAGVMLGWHRDTRDGKLVGFEFMRITFDAEGIRFHAQPGGQPETIFPATTHESGRIVFEQPGHDFPKRVTYRREADGRLFARVDDGRDDGAAMEWTWSRCAADGD